MCDTVARGSKMEICLCNRLHNVDRPTLIFAYAFSGSLCYIRQFETLDGPRFCLIIFSLADCRHLHFPHDEYKFLICKLYALQCTQSILPPAKSNPNVYIKQRPFIDDFQIKLGDYSFTIGPVSAFGLVKTTPFGDIDVFSINKNDFSCNREWDICVCKTCPVFKRLIEFEAKFANRKLENIIL